MLRFIEIANTYDLMKFHFKSNTSSYDKEEVVNKN